MINRREFLRTAACSAPALALRAQSSASQLPNVVLIYLDDFGYGDLSCYGAKGYRTNNIDRLAREGMRFTDFYVAQPVCSASRAALLTGCYPNRIGILGALSPNARHGISDGETTLGQMLKSRGYATALFGKWHLGHHPPFLPMRHGFDEYFGLPYSNDMWPRHPETPKAYPDLPLLDGDKVVEMNPDMNRLTSRYTERAVSFIDRNRARPFFLYLPHSMPHVPLGVSERFRGKSKVSPFADVTLELDDSVGQIMKALRRHDLAERTLFIFTSDNGPWLSYGNHGGTAGPLREGKGTTWEGGVRVPCIMRWPGIIPAGSVCRTPAMTIDILPSLAAVTGATLPNLPIDGRNMSRLMRGESDAAPREACYFYWSNELQAVRSGRWKLHLPHPYRTLEGRPGGTGGIPTRYAEARCGLELYDLENDVGEKTNLAERHADMVEKLSALGRAFDAEMQRGKRPPGRLEDTGSSKERP